MRIETIIPRKGINDDNLGKKHALYKLISDSTADYIWLMDDDVVAPEVSESDLLDAIGDADMLILPVRMRSLSTRPSLLEYLQMAEYAAIWQLSIDQAQKGHAIMCSGANLLVKRKSWLLAWPDLHPDIPSGDDMFLLESFKRQGKTIRVVQSQRYDAIVRPKTSFKELLYQRMRWAGKAPHYRDKDILFYGALVLISNILQVLCPLLLLLKFPYEYALIRRREPSTLFLVALCLELIYPYYMLVSLIGGMFSKRPW